jgi:LPS sulfotransferase NodH
MSKRIQKNDFIVITTQRTGSSMFLDILDGYENIEGHMELFLDQDRKSPAMAGKNDYPRYYEWKKGELKIRPFSVFRYLSDLYARDSSVGFKLMYSHLLKYPEILAFIAYKRLKIVHLIRNNFLDIVISEKLAELSGKSHTTTSTETNTQTIQLEPSEVLNRIKKLDQNTQFIRKLMVFMKMNNTIEIYYEDLLQNTSDAMADVKSFLNIDLASEQKTSNLIKRQTKNKENLISNYDELKNAFSITEYKNLINN